MNNLNANIFKKNKKRNIILLIICFILLGISVALIYFGIKNENKKLPEPVSMKSLKNNKKTIINKYSYVDVSIEPFLFAVYENNGVEENGKYYLVMDKENNLYIIYMNDDKYNEINKEDIKKKSVRVLGITKEISTDVKDLAIKSYNELMNDEYLTSDNFKEYVSELYLDTTIKLNDSILYYIGAGIIGYLFIILIINILIIIIKNKKTIKSIDCNKLATIDAELSEMINSEYEKMKFYMLKNSIIDFSSSIVIVNYDDILWIYPFEQRYNGLLINKYLKVVDKNNKKYKVASTKFLDKNKDDILEAIQNKIKEKNKNIIIGYSKENKKIIKEKLKELKNK